MLTEIQLELGNARRRECASSDRAKGDCRKHVGASVEGDGCAPRCLGSDVRGTLNVLFKQVGRSRKVDRRRFLREWPIEIVRIPPNCKYRTAYTQ